ncbi:carbamoyltransferase family protein [Myxococcus xanthus DK 1622]|uniref:Carbamoyltransferase family protein n=2 Tax=Myxococcus xanthus TaxID=34 RepID=Q1DCS8_MYXXD|nr:carbamoyltransferase family protein [Myxococcus xanthus DK 1622]QZZ48818.1 nebramycin 5' synthase [Myxococcus xanthus]SDW40469.1 carbamoyltransferase [Myxococcus xanthus]
MWGFPDRGYGTMNLLGVYIGLHDSNVALSVDGRVRYAKSERLTGIKHHRSALSFVREMCERWGVTRLDGIAFSDGDRNGLGACKLGELWKKVSPVAELGSAPTYCVDHHYAHILSTWPVADTAELELGFAIDGRGDNEARKTVIARPGARNPELVHHNATRSFGRLLERIGELMKLSATPGNESDLAGKVMGAQAYGEVDQDFVRSVDVEALGERLYDFTDKVPWRGRVPIETPDFFQFDNPSFRDWLSTVHALLAAHTQAHFARFARPDMAIAYAGGCAQNVVINQELFLRYPRLVVPPHGYDGGLSLGCLELLRIQLGLPRFSTEGFPYWQEDDCEDAPTESTIAQAVELLAQGKIVGWFQGRGEVGPRALGNRSIFMDPRQHDGKDRLNFRVKHRETWRPYGATVLLERTPEWFDLAEESRYMLRSVPTRPERQREIPAIVHQDGTCRVQTVGRDAPTSARRLVERFQQHTGLPMLLNTSLNAGGSPIFATRAQCRDFFAAVDMDALFMGNEVLVRQG